MTNFCFRYEGWLRRKSQDVSSIAEISAIVTQSDGRLSVGAKFSEIESTEETQEKIRAVSKKSRKHSLIGWKRGPPPNHVRQEELFTSTDAGSMSEDKDDLSIVDLAESKIESTNYKTKRKQMRKTREGIIEQLEKSSDEESSSDFESKRKKGKKEGKGNDIFTL